MVERVSEINVIRFSLVCVINFDNFRDVLVVPVLWNWQCAEVYGIASFAHVMGLIPAKSVPHCEAKKHKNNKNYVEGSSDIDLEMIIQNFKFMIDLHPILLKKLN